MTLSRVATSALFVFLFTSCSQSAPLAPATEDPEPAPALHTRVSVEEVRVMGTTMKQIHRRKAVGIGRSTTYVNTTVLEPTMPGTLLYFKSPVFPRDTVAHWSSRMIRKEDQLVGREVCLVYRKIEEGIKIEDVEFFDEGKTSCG